MGEVKDPEAAMKETTLLAGLFQTMVDDCKVRLSQCDPKAGLRLFQAELYVCMYVCMRL